MQPPTSSQKDRRCSPRWPAKRTTRVTCLKGSLGLGANVAVSVFDLSEIGIRLVAKTALNRGQEIELNLSGISQPRPVKVLASVIWSSTGVEGTHWVGARFQKPIGYSEVLNLTHQPGR